MNNKMPAGEFKAKCLKLMDEVNEAHHPVVITKDGKHVAKLVPIDDEVIDYFGCMSGTVEYDGDLISPIGVDWEVLGD